MLLPKELFTLGERHVILVDRNLPGCGKRKVVSIGCSEAEIPVDAASLGVSTRFEVEAYVA